MSATAPTVNTAMSELLSALGFETMARDVLTETEPERLRRYVRVIVKNTPEGRYRVEIANRFRLLRLY